MYPMAAQNHIIPNDINSSQLQNSYPSPFISRPSLFSSSHHQLQPYETVVNPELPISQPNVFQWPPVSQAVQHPGFTPLSVPVDGIPWKCPEWMANQSIQPGSYMNFNAQQPNRLPFKRKAAPDMDEDIQTKRLLTEEKMSAHLNGLHISSQFKPHSINQSGQLNEPLDVDGETADSFTTYPCSVQDIEEKLKRAQKITVSDVVKRIQEDPILPAAILERFEQPCKALVVWQPPQRITDLIVSKVEQEKQNNDDENADNNNVDFVDANNDLVMDTDS